MLAAVDESIDSLETILENQFSLPSFRRGQKEIISSVLDGKDVLAVLPTGGGKSLCYQMPAIASQSLVVVVSPLIALMKDQVSSLERRGIPAGCLHSAQTDAEKMDVFARMNKPGPFLLYLSPERVQKPGFQNWVLGRKIALFAIDEAHCVSQWGHDFREEYGQLRLLKTLRPEVPILALTASATPLVLNDIARNLALQKPEKHIHGFYRPNLYYQVENCADEEEKFAYLDQALRQTPTGRVIIYCGTRNSTEEVAARLKTAYQGVGYYHAGIDGERRSKIQNQYATGKIRILAATNAFGMGIDHPDVRLVVHFQMPGNIDSLYQEMGRAGRDGDHSTCLMLYSKKDKGLQSYFIQTSQAPAEIKKSRWNTLEALVAYAEGGECRHGEILTYYRDSQRILRCEHCDSCQPESARKIQTPDMQSSAVIERLPEAKRRAKKKEKAKAASVSVLDSAQMEVFNDLKDWRRDKALELDVPAFVIFSDRTLRDLASQKPKSLSDLEGVHGFGEVKIEKFGTELLAKLQSWH